MKRKVLFLVLGYCLLSSCSFNAPAEITSAYQDLPETIDFNFHVKPILSDRCYTCHGPDANTRKANLRLDLQEEAFKRLTSGNHAFVAKKPGRSESIERILSDDPERLMPPPESNLNLTAREKAILIKWIEQGAQWKPHWAFVKPKKPPLPEQENPDWTVRNEIDLLVQRQLREQGLEPSKEASKQRLLRRVSMDLTGLPPTLEQIDAYMNDQSPDAYEKVVDELLATDANAERLALDWMDISRYADSHGLHADGWRLMWPWRDWVINAFKQNMPYNQFITWQLAGDLLPGATKEQKLATAFNRNHPMTAEGGAIEEEFRLNYVWDRTETVGTALLGLTVACARCHDHKFDPISQKDYFQMTAFFNNVKELGMTGDDGNYGPMLALPDSQTEEKLNALDKTIQQKSKQLELTKKELKDLNTFMNKLPGNSRKNGLVGHYPLERLSPRPGKKKGYLVDGNPAVTIRESPKIVEGKKGKAFEFTGEYDEVHLDNVPNFEWTDRFSAGLWLYTTKRQAGKTQTLLGTTGEKNNFWRGWDFYLDSLNHLNVRLIHSLPHNYIHVRSKDSIKTKEWRHVAFTYDGSGKAEGLTLFIDGEEIGTNIPYDKLYKSIKTITVATHQLTDQPVRVAKSYRNYTGENGIFLGRIDDIHIYSRRLVPLEVRHLAKEDGNLENPDNSWAADYWVSQSPEVVKLEKELKKLRGEWLSHMNPVMEVMVMEEMPTPRPTFVYNRGDYEQPMYEVDANTPEVLPAFSKDYPKNRLGLSQWIFSEDNPLTARVTVNRYWQMLFGNGLVETPQDFGVQGSLPSHPELIDWLATSFVESGWDVKALLKTMVMSHTYRQTSKASLDLRETDPTNRYLARSNSYRLPAEMIRDNALAASGLLVQHVGGKSVKPYQPGNLWIEKNSFSHKLLNYKESEGDSLYRRGLYTFIRRTSPHPAMTAFDTPSREVCTVKRENTNTPLQALVLMNDTQFVEASRVLAERMQKEGGTSLEDQITYGFRLAVSRKPKKEESEILKELYERQSERFIAFPKEANELLTVGKKPMDRALNPSKTAALTMVANTILNHDETYMKR
ncbi:DUF1553 domain-containing protein [Flavobacteriaceae bacterium TP-CH-4]|uniref:DUF1553 domain-containing protein n=1 Tax=Pelagihabitans pacificus TaxID=2696054 RepID=A0A967AXL1_9FLAO|nr:DUF1553 domain-containing protein [Pelagihabitans pacificus]NHF60985.1 DUF1553 domain-containing protein [Pelagihabitans pacificus]